jgi:transposase
MDLLEQLALTNADPALVAQLRAMLTGKDERIGATEAQLHAMRLQQEELLAEGKSKDFKIKALTLELAHHKRIRFGKASEVYSGEQLDLFNETVDADLAAMQAELDALQGQRRAPCAAQPRRPAAAATGIAAHRASPRTGILPVRRLRPRSGEDRRGCRRAARRGTCALLRAPPYPSAIRLPWLRNVTAAPIPPAVIDGGMAAPGLLAWVAVSKFANHLPLYRLEQIATRQGVPLARSTLAGWVSQLGEALQPLSDRLAALLRQRACLHADETPVRHLDPGQGKTKQAYLWAYRSNRYDDGPPIIVFDYQTGRAGAHARAFLQGWRGHLMVDDYAGYKALFADGVTELACLAHVRRKFFELHAANGSPIAAEALKRIAVLYAVEQQAADIDRTPTTAAAARQASAGRTACMAAGDATERGDRQRHRQGRRACAQTLDGTGALRRFRRTTD